MKQRVRGEGEIGVLVRQRVGLTDRALRRRERRRPGGEFDQSRLSVSAMFPEQPHDPWSWAACTA